MIAFEGNGAAGKGLQIGNLIQALDPRGFKVYAVKNETEEEWMHPFLWRFWTKIPEKGRIAIFDTSWYRRVMIERFEGKTPEKELEKDFASIRAFEKQLTDDGMVIIKLFLKIDRKEQKKRFEKLLASKDTAWRVSKGDLKRNHDFKEYKAINEAAENGCRLRTVDSDQCYKEERSQSGCLSGGDPGNERSSRKKGTGRRRQSGKENGNEKGNSRIHSGKDGSFQIYAKRGL